MKHTIFGESHGPAIGVTLTGVPAGIELDLEELFKYSNAIAWIDVCKLTEPEVSND